MKNKILPYWRLGLMQNDVIGFAQCCECDNFCLFENEKQDSGLYKCMECQGVGYMCKNYDKCKSYYNESKIIRFILRQKSNNYSLLKTPDIPISLFYCYKCKKENKVDTNNNICIIKFIKSLL